jgi:hypothetical protein
MTIMSFLEYYISFFDYVVFLSAILRIRYEELLMFLEPILLNSIIIAPLYENSLYASIIFRPLHIYRGKPAYINSLVKEKKISAGHSMKEKLKDYILNN